MASFVKPSHYIYKSLINNLVIIIYINIINHLSMHGFYMLRSSNQNTNKTIFLHNLINQLENKCIIKAIIRDIQGKTTIKPSLKTAGQKQAIKRPIREFYPLIWTSDCPIVPICDTAGL